MTGDGVDSRSTGRGRRDVNIKDIFKGAFNKCPNPLNFYHVIPTKLVSPDYSEADGVMDQKCKATSAMVAGPIATDKSVVRKNWVWVRGR